MNECCKGCDLVEEAGALGIHVHTRGFEVLDEGCGLSAAQQTMLAARIDDHRNALALQGGPALQ